jgi:hypothetical protein
MRKYTSNAKARVQLALVAIPIILIVVAFKSCNKDSKKDSKMEANIKAIVTKMANDPKSYELIELKPLDTVTIGKICKWLVDTDRVYSDNQNCIEMKSDKTVIGYLMEHDYRMKNAFGALMVAQKVVAFDLDGNVIENDTKYPYDAYKERVETIIRKSK